MTGSLQRPSRLDVTWTGDGDHVVVTIVGEVDASNADDLIDAITEGAGTHTAVRVDMVAVEFMDSSLLRALLQCQARFARVGVDFKVRNVTPQARRVFAITRLESLLEQ